MAEEGWEVVVPSNTSETTTVVTTKDTKQDTKEETKAVPKENPDIDQLKKALADLQQQHTDVVKCLSSVVRSVSMLNDRVNSFIQAEKEKDMMSKWHYSDYKTCKLMKGKCFFNRED
jgi:hypothetical protein